MTNSDRIMNQTFWIGVTGLETVHLDFIVDVLRESLHKALTTRPLPVLTGR